MLNVLHTKFLRKVSKSCRKCRQKLQAFHMLFDAPYTCDIATAVC